MAVGFILNVGPWQLLILLVPAAIVIVPICIVMALVSKQSIKSSPATEMICRKCGVANSPWAKFCTGCGGNLEVEASARVPVGGSISNKPRISQTMFTLTSRSI